MGVVEKVPMSVDNYMREEDVRADLERLRFISNQHQRGCECAYCAEVRAFEFMLKGPHPVIHRQNCGDCYHVRSGPPLAQKEVIA